MNKLYFSDNLEILRERNGKAYNNVSLINICLIFE